jgi:hypothetical protein
LPIKAAQTSSPGTDPDIPAAILCQAKDKVVTQAIVASIMAEGRSVGAAQAWSVPIHRRP